MPGSGTGAVDVRAGAGWVFMTNSCGLVVEQCVWEITKGKSFSW